MSILRAEYKLLILGIGEDEMKLREQVKELMINENEKIFEDNNKIKDLQSLEEDLQKMIQYFSGHSQ